MKWLLFFEGHGQLELENTGPSERFSLRGFAVLGEGLQPLGCWDRCFEFL
jgi:hypothetical protein